MTLNVGKIQALCFDVDGTLRDTDDIFVNSVARFFRPFAWMLPQRDYRHAARRFVMHIEGPMNSLHGLSDRLGVDDEMVAWTYFWKDKRGSKRPQQLLISGVAEMLAALSSRYPLAVVTARDQRGTQAFLDHYDLGKYFTAIASGQVTPRTKPSPQPVIWAAQKMGVSPENCLMIGDTTVDIRAGVSAGAQTVGVLCGFGEEPELHKAGANLVLPTTSQLTEVLFKNI